MNVIISLQEKQKEKQLKYERKMLRELSLKTLRSNIRDAFQMQELHRQYEDYCIELGIESYLLGARYSKFGYYGESFFDVKYRALEEEQQLTETLFQFLTSMTMREIKLKDEELLFESCQQFIGLWWQEGYEKGERRYRLKLH
ncbi:MULTISPECIES: DUF2521 family protein [Bacillus]|jgi:hypothetical protein|uniref:KINB signaling pathway activation protein n=1 Tax=Bacillus cereus TaxID=1396 RepID=A0A9X6B9V3_BACCE|nr:MULTISPECIES: DUF2521 family protein [Bacillus cereus group]NUH91497.1 DUF2521 family protein [Bacillus thuringiensis]NUH96850.1 DUF2521 family protein [Bacillus thuringiensis]NUI02096.1 DUF2521 family protein [Bacillus thuringiensis]NUI07319.1 DUF2521 family protein [Bacillus thuringiensis]NUI15328.1 DUF2521 family protein [Bacillus thuringiensis]